MHYRWQDSVPTSIATGLYRRRLKDKQKLQESSMSGSL